MATRYSVQVKTDPRRHVQDPKTVPWIVVDEFHGRRPADDLARQCKDDGNVVRVVEVRS